MYSIAWGALGVVGLVAFVLGRRVWIDPDWESGDWWALASWISIRGAVFGFLFPVVRTDHTRRQERRNAAWVMGWSGALALIGIVMALWERSQ